MIRNWGYGLPKLNVTRDPPANLVEPDGLLFAHEYSKEIAESAAELLSDVKVLPNGYLQRNFFPLPQSFAVSGGGLTRARRMASGLLHSLPPSPVTTIDRALFATDEFSNGFFHWFCDVLPRLEALDSVAPAEMKNRTLVIPAMADYPYVHATLGGYDLGAVHVLREREKARCADLLVALPVAPTGNYRPELMQSIRERFRRRFPAPGGQNRCFVSRSKAPRRRIQNEGELQPVLARHGFTAVAAEELPFEEQVRQIGSAAVLAGNHGAGLTHMLWMEPGSCVVELRRRGDRWNNCYFSLASALGIKYFYLLCEGTKPRGETHSTDLIVDALELDRVLASATAAAGM
jgi:capsular polysaccharide biosynthesis protein